MYDQNKYECIGDPIKFAIEGKKPYIFAKLKNKQSGRIMVVGSVHHPGGGHNFLEEEILEQAKQLCESPPKAEDYYVMGDLNHVEEFFSDGYSGNIIYPQEGTMAGSDYDNVNRAIDALLTSRDSSSVKLQRLSDLSLAPRTEAIPLEINFKTQDAITIIPQEELTTLQRTPLVVNFKSQKPQAYPGFFQRVSNSTLRMLAKDIAKSAMEAARHLTNPNLKLGQRVIL